jgi:hypothetical protein
VIVHGHIRVVEVTRVIIERPVFVDLLQYCGELPGERLASRQACDPFDVGRSSPVNVGVPTSPM